MAKSSTLYISMFLILGLGLWGVMHLGRSLHAPPDISGVWNIASPSTSSSSFTVEQSGQFVKVSAAGKPSLHLRLAQTQADSDHGLQMLFNDGEQTLSVRTPPNAGPGLSDRNCEFRFSGPLEVVWIASRAHEDATAALPSQPGSAH